MEEAKNLGVEDSELHFINNTKIGVDITMEELDKKYDHIVFACGTSLARPLQAKNSDAEGIVYAVDFLTETTRNLLDNKELKYNLQYIPNITNEIKEFIYKVGKKTKIKKNIINKY